MGVSIGSFTYFLRDAIGPYLVRPGMPLVLTRFTDPIEPRAWPDRNVLIGIEAVFVNPCFPGYLFVEGEIRSPFIPGNTIIVLE